MAKLQKKAYHHGNLRQALIDAAVVILRKKGVAGLSLRGLAIQLGVSHGAPYRHFKTKTDLLQAIAITGFQQLGENCRQAQQKFPDDPEKQLFESGMSGIIYVSQNPEVIDLMFGGVLPPHQWGPELKQANDDSINGLFQIIENGKKVGLYGRWDTRELALTALSTVQGLSVFVASGILKSHLGSKRKLRMVAKRVYDILTQGMFVR